MKKPTTADSKRPGNVLRLPVWVLALRSLPLAAALALALLLRHPAVLIGAAILALASLAGLWAWLRFRIEYDRDGLRVRSITQANRYCPYAKLWGIESKKRLYLDKGSVRLRRGEAWEDLVKTAQRGYQRGHGKRIPRVSSIRRSWDPFNGNVQQPGEFIFVYILLYALGLGFLAFMLLHIEQEADGPVLIFPLGYLSLHTIFVIFHLYVGRNADILPRWFVEICFRPSALTFRKD